MRREFYFRVYNYRPQFSMLNEEDTWAAQTEWTDFNDGDL